MRRQHNKEIEQACSTIAAAIVQLIAAIRGQAEASPDPVLNTLSDLTRKEVPARINEPAGSRDAFDGLDDCASSARRINVYLAGSRGCATLARTYGTQIMAELGLDKAPYIIKCGTTTGGLAERLSQIGQDGYGAAIRTANGIEIEPGFAAWIAHTISTSRAPRDPAVKLLPRAVAVVLPPALTRRGFDAALHRSLKARSLSSISRHDIPKRFVAYDLVETRISAATELYALSPHDNADGDLLLDAIEDIVGKARIKRA